MEAAEEFVTFGELTLLLAWLCAPWLLIALLAQFAFLRRRGALARGRRWRVAVAAGGTVVLTLVLAGGLLAVLPLQLLPRRLLPEVGPSLPPPHFVPGIVAAAVAASALGAWAVRNRPASRPAV